MFSPRNDCEHFDMELPEFTLAEEVKADLESYTSTWGLCEEFKNGMKDLEQEDWLSFR